MRPTLERLGNYLPAAVVLALPTVFIPNAVDSFILPRAAIAIVGAGIGCGLALLLPRRPTLGALRIPLIAAAAAALLAFAFSISWPLSTSGAYTRYESLPIRLSYLALLAVPVWLLRDRLSRTLVEAGFVLGTAIASLEAIIQAASAVNFRPDGNIGNANLLGALIAMAFPLAVARGFRGGRFAIAWWLGAALMVGGLVTSTSRSGGLGAVAGCLALVVFAMRGTRWIAITAAGSSAVVGFALWAIVFGPLGFLNNDPARTRLQLWPDALRLIAARPISGWGEDATGLSFGRFLSADWAPGVIYDRTHSGLLEVAATQGIVGLLALGWVLFVLFRGTWRYRFTESVGAHVAACIGYTVWVIFNFDWVPATAAFWLLAGTAWSAVRAAETAETPSATVQPARGIGAATRSVGALTLAVAAVFFGVMPVLADIWYSQGRPQLAVMVDPLQARYHWDLGLNKIALGDQRGGVEELQRAADFGETEPQVYVDLGDAELKLGDRASARRDYNRALLIDPYFAPAHQRLQALGG
ncbi:MAG TPA: O-antigen ligase family protein [Candidatus Dormibacteraeota bacterium]|nr:O-antigen ligase family protein [Candidatus Dormibacteraeota bacterium]